MDYYGKYLKYKTKYLQLMANLNDIVENDINMDFQEPQTGGQQSNPTRIVEEEYPHAVEVHYDTWIRESDSGLTVLLEVDRLAKDLNGKIMKFTKGVNNKGGKYHATDSPKHFINFKMKEVALSFIEQIKQIKGVSVAIYQGKWNTHKNGYYGGIKRSVRRLTK